MTRAAGGEVKPLSANKRVVALVGTWFVLCSLSFESTTGKELLIDVDLKLILAITSQAR